MKRCTATLKTPEFADNGDCGRTGLLVGDQCHRDATHGAHCFTHARNYADRWARLDALAGRVG